MCDNLSGCEVCSSILIAIISEEFTGCVAAPGDRECRAIVRFGGISWISGCGN
jgi:hypothetical protein